MYNRNSESIDREETTLMYKNILFDFGGVVVDFNPRNFLMDRFMNKHAEEVVYDLTFGSQEWLDLDRGVITREEANRLMMENAAHVNREFEVRTVIEEWASMLRTKKTTVRTMKELKAGGYHLFYLTNIPTDIMDELRQRDWFALFDGGVASCDVHLCKPEPEIYTTLMRLSPTVSSDIASFTVSAETDMATAEAQMTALLLERFEADTDAFTVSSLDALEDTMSSVTSILTILLGGIAAISLIVGGIGIMNIMLVTVTERTREIGIRKAIGAGRGAILQQFLLESVVLCMLGCAVGVFLSWIVLRVISVVVSSLSMTFSLEWNVVWIAVGFCFFIGVVFGLYPANKAAKMAPIDALHYGG